MRGGQGRATGETGPGKAARQPPGGLGVSMAGAGAEETGPACLMDGKRAADSGTDLPDRDGMGE